jgi:hypothetical protein
VSKKQAPTRIKSEEEEETQPLEKKKGTLLIFTQLLEKSLLIGKDFNEILSASFITKLVDNNFRIWVSPRKVMNPQPLSFVVPHTHSMVRATPIIHT